MNSKILLNLLIVVLLIGGIITGIYAVRQMTGYLTFAQQVVGEPIDITARVIGPDEAVINWTTDQAVISLILYGTNPAELNNTQTELSSLKTHKVTLGNLLPDTAYYYKVQVGQEIFDQNGSPWQFKTAASESTPKLTEEEFRKLYGIADLRYDYNKDGIVNGFDYQLYLQEK